MGDILSETLLIYGRHFWKFLLLVAVLQVPVSLLALVPIEGREYAVLVNLVSGIALMFIHAAVIAAVGQHYVLNTVSVGGCYLRVMWRAVSLMLLAIAWGILTAAFLLAAESLLPAEDSPQSLVPLLILPIGAVLLVFSIYMTTVAPAMVVEGYRSVSAVVRGFRLARSSEWRILLFLIVYSLVALGLVIVLIIPFTIATFAMAPEGDGTGAVSIPMVLGGIVIGVVVPPVISIATTLLYYDLRVRKEGYNMSLLSKEMGVATI